MNIQDAYVGQKVVDEMYPEEIGVVTGVTKDGFTVDFGTSKWTYIAIDAKYVSEYVEVSVE